MQSSQSTFSKYFRPFFGSSILLLFVVLAVFASWIAPFGPDEMDLTQRLAGPSWLHFFGCDLNGGDVFSQIIYGSRTSLYVGLATVIISIGLGTIVGLWTGYHGGWADWILMRIVDVLMAFPGILLAMSLAALMGPSLNNVVIAISATGWTSTARLVRGQVLSAKNYQFVEASHALGSTSTRLIWRHILPNILPHLCIQATFSLSGVIIIESSLSFLGFGAQDIVASWGGLLSQGTSVLLEAPHVSIAPGIAIILLVLALNFLGDWLRDYLDPKYH